MVTSPASRPTTAWEAHRLDQILATHLIEPSLLRADDFDTFILDRARQLLDLVEKAIGKAVVGRETEDVVTAFGASLSADASASHVVRGTVRAADRSDRETLDIPSLDGQ